MPTNLPPRPKPLYSLWPIFWDATIAVAKEIERLIDAAGQNRWGHRDATAILLAYRHGLRASELVALRWDDPSPLGASMYDAPKAGKRPSIRLGARRCGRCAAAAVGDYGQVAVRLRERARRPA
jgi:site-specific recombinase XerC